MHQTPSITFKTNNLNQKNEICLSFVFSQPTAHDGLIVGPFSVDAIKPSKQLRYDCINMNQLEGA